MKRGLLVAADEPVAGPAVGQHHDGSIRTYMRHKVAKLDVLNNPRGVGESGTLLFQDCVVFVNGITNPPVEEIRRLVALHGGKALAYRSQPITHLVCDYLTDAQLKQELGRWKLNTVKGRIHNVTAKWIVDSIARGERQGEAAYSPPGLKGRHGADITRLFATTTTSLPSSAAAKRIVSGSDSAIREEGVIEVVDDGDDALAELSASQRELLEALPEDLRSDALSQLLAHIEHSKFAVEDLAPVIVPLEDHADDPAPPCPLGYDPDDLQLLVNSVFGSRTLTSLPLEAVQQAGLGRGAARVLRVRAAVLELLGDFDLCAQAKGWTATAVCDLLLAFFMHLLRSGDLDLVYPLQMAVQQWSDEVLAQRRDPDPDLKWALGECLRAMQRQVRCGK